MTEQVLEKNFSTVRDFRLHWTNPYTLKWCGICLLELNRGDHRAYSQNQNIYFCRWCANNEGLAGDEEFLDSVVRASYDETENREPQLARIATILENLVEVLKP